MHIKIYHELTAIMVMDDNPYHTQSSPVRASLDIRISVVGVVAHWKQMCSCDCMHQRSKHLVGSEPTNLIYVGKSQQAQLSFYLSKIAKLKF